MALCFFVVALFASLLIFYLALYLPHQHGFAVWFSAFYQDYKLLFLYLLIINILTFILFAVDKRRAVHGRWRVRESLLLGLSFIGGAFGGLLAMNLFRHKIRKGPFLLGLPAMLILQAAALLYFTHLL